MTTTASGSTLELNATVVPMDGGQQVQVRPGKPWPSPYRGSKYSIIRSRKHGEVASWSHMGELQTFTEVPSGLIEELINLGKPDGHGSYRITASGEVLTKIPADDYAHLNEAPVGRGFVSVYLGKQYGPFDFTAFSNDPAPPSDVGDVEVWGGLPFNHGETWSVHRDNVIRWNWQDYYFESAFDHPELVETYRRYRPTGGRIYLNEHGHVWGNVNLDDLDGNERNRVSDAFKRWKQTASDSERRLVTRRLERTKNPSAKNGLLPIYFGHLSQFDDGVVPKPVIDDTSYYAQTATDHDQ